MRRLSRVGRRLSSKVERQPGCPAISRLSALGGLIFLAACGGLPDSRLIDLAIEDQLTPMVELASVPFHPQATRHDCGPAALAMMLNWTGIETNPQDLAPKVYTPGRKGTLQADIVQAVRREQRLGIELDGIDALLRELSAGNPVLVLQNLGLSQWPKWHYAVAVGYNLEDRTLILHSGKQANLRLSLAAFERSWHDGGYWGLTVTRADHPPVTVDEGRLLAAASGLEQSGMGDSAALAYGALLQRWPDNLAALMGWGNARYARGDYDAASKAFRHAVTLHPEATEAWNNLAYSLFEQRRFPEAEMAAREAIQRGGPHQAAAEATLAEILQKRG